ncbi:MAG TPA: transaldolase family protein [Bacteroidales bacterium]|nr:transaldolase family protein [Bacteroidales bacterium]
MADLSTRISDYVWKDLIEKHVNGKSEPFWESLKKTGSEVWLDTADIIEAENSWTSEMTAITTNNTLLNNEVQKGIYDVFIAESKAIVRELPPEERVKEIAFILNARHGLRLSQKFKGFINVELHADFAHDINALFNYGKRYHDICPEQFIIKIPYTAEGLIAARMLKDAGVKTNISVGFSARQNVLAVRFARPDYVNVFIGRIGEFISENKLGDGTGAGEMTAIASQNWITGLSAENQWQTKQVAASIRNPKQLEMIAGTDIITIPPHIVTASLKDLKGKFNPRMHENYDVSIFDEAKREQIEKLWKVDAKILKFSSRLASKVPSSANEFLHVSHEEGCEDLFPFLTKEEKAIIAADGRIPVCSKWEKKLAEGKIALDSLLNQAALVVFHNDQKMLDERIRGIIET